MATPFLKFSFNVPPFKLKIFSNEIIILQEKKPERLYFFLGKQILKLK
jgi:hypothetical protein